MKIDLAYISHILTSIAAILILAGLSSYSYKHRDMPGAFAFSIACLLGLLWSFGSIFETTAIALDAKIFWRKFQVMWQLSSATAITIFLLEYAQPKRWTTRRNLFLLSIPPILVAVLVLTNHYHHLFWTNFNFDKSLVAIPGPLMKFFIAYVYLIFLINIAVFIWLFIHSPENRWPVAIMIIGQITMRVMFMIEFANQTGTIPYSPLGITFTSILYAIVLFRFRIFGPQPFARQVLLRKIPIGILVLDDVDKVCSLNPAAEKMLNTSFKIAKGEEIKALLPAYPEKIAMEDDDQNVEFSLLSESKGQTYELEISKLRDWRNINIGKLLLITNVTEQRKAQQQFTEQERVLATLKEREHLAGELHDDLAQVLSFINMQSQTVSRLLKKGETESAAEYLEKLIEVARGVDVDIRDSIQGMRAELLEDGLLITLEKYIARYQKDHAIQTDLIFSEIMAKNILTPMVEIQLFRIIQEALTNVRKHADASQVKIIFERLDSALCISVEDNGHGFDLSDRSFRSSNHFGLQMIRERAEAIGGSLDLFSEIGIRTKIKICVPTKIVEVE